VSSDKTRDPVSILSWRCDNRDDNFRRVSTEYKFKVIGLLGKYGDISVANTLRHLCAFLRRRRLRILLDENSDNDLHQTRGIEFADRATLGQECDLIVVVGGDGTLLDAARSMVDAGVPLLGVNLGRLGFLVDVSPADMTQRLEEILRGHYQEEQRCLLTAAIIRDGTVVEQSDALNDVVVHKQEPARIIEMQTYLDGTFINTYRADGLIISTPTGSTAYNLSGGGPILHPSLNSVVLLPICPHTLTNRPIVVDAQGEIEILVTGWYSENTPVICDGQVVLNTEPGDRIVIRSKSKKLQLLQPAGHDYFEVLRAKLAWGTYPK
jgi:NAD+ kinase